VWNENNEHENVAGWVTGEPQYPSLRQCAQVNTSLLQYISQSAGRKSWISVDCLEPRFQYPLCEAAVWDYMSTLTWVAVFPPNPAPTTITIDGVIAWAQLPANSTALVYGSTISQPIRQQLETDNFTLLTSNDAMIVRANCPGFMMICGKVSIEMYNVIARATRFEGQHAGRNSLVFSYVYWSDYRTRDLFYNVETATAFGVYPVSNVVSNKAADPLANITSWYTKYDTASAYCAARSMRPVEPRSLEHTAALERAIWWGPTTLGVRRTAAGAQTFRTMTTALPLNFSLWSAAEPKAQVTLYNCSYSAFDEAWCIEEDLTWEFTNETKVQTVGSCANMRRAYTGWYTQFCNDVVPAIACESTSPQGNYSTHVLNVRSETTLRKVDFASTLLRVGGTAAETVHLDDLATSIFGFTVQIHHEQCRAGDLLVAPTLPSTDFALTYNASLCALFVKGLLGPDTMTVYRSYVDTVNFVSASKSRRQVQVSVVYWTAANQTNVLYDNNRRAALYQMHFQNPVSWNEAFARCRMQSIYTSMASIRDFSVDRLVSYNLTNTQSRMPLALRFNGDNRFEWMNGDEVNYVNWEGYGPDPKYRWTACVTAESSVIGAANWRAINCSVPMFNYVVCEDLDYRFAYQLSYTLDDALIAGNRSLYIFNGSTILTSTNATIYGATVSRREAECHPSDHYALTTSDDKIAVVTYKTSDCLIAFAGMNTDARYAAVLLGLKFVGYPRHRADLTFGLIYWTSPFVRDMVMDPVTRHAYAAYPTNWYWTPPENYTMDSAYSICSRNGLQPVEIDSFEEMLEVRKVQRFGAMLIGMRRVASTQTFLLNTTGVPAAFTMWRPLSPSTNTSKRCVLSTDTLDWIDVSCQERNPSMGCEVNSWKRSVAVTISTLMPDTFAEEAQPRPIDTVITNATDGTDFGARTVYGASVTLDINQCGPSDFLWLAGSTPLGFLVKYEPSICTLFIDENSAGLPADVMMAIVETVRFTNGDALRLQAAFSVSLWTRAKEYLLLHHERRQAYTFITPPTPTATWLEMHDACRRLGPRWFLPQILADDQMRLANFNITSSEVPIGLFAANGVLSWNVNFERPNVIDAYINWDAPTSPTANWATTDRCVSMQATNGLWTTRSCTTSTFTRGVCVSSRLDLTYFKVFTLISSPGTALITMFPNENATNIPTYGLTVQQPTLQYQSGDRFLLGLAHRYLVVKRDDNGVLMIVGSESPEVYRRALNNVKFRGYVGTRATLKFAYIWWASVTVRDMVMDVTTGHVYTTHRAHWYYDPASIASYPLNPIRSVCTNNDFYSYEPGTTDEYLQQLLTQKFGKMFVGAKRRTAGQLYFDGFNSTVSIPFQPWQPGLPAPVGQDCVEQDTYFDWIEQTCNAVFYSIACERDVWEWSGQKSYAMVVPAPNVIPRPMSTVITALSESDFLGEAVTYGATVSVAKQGCHPLDLIAMPTTNNPTAKLQYFATVCSLFASVPQGTTLTNLRLDVAQANFTSGDPARVQVTFVLLFWTVPFSYLLMDAENDYVLRLMFSATPLTWMESYAKCRELGPRWYLPLHLNRMQNDLQMFNTTTSTRALGLHIDLDLQKYQWSTSHEEFHPMREYMNWDHSVVDWGGSALKQCTAMRPNGKWTNVDCYSPEFTEFFCQTPRHDLKVKIARAILTAPHQTSFVVLATLPDVVGTIYGVTVQQPQAQVQPADKMLLARTNDKVIVSYDHHSILQLVGTATFDEYRDVVTNITWYGFLGYRTVLRFSYMWWTHPSVRDAVRVASTGNFYVPYHLSWALDVSLAAPPAQYGYFQGSTFCNDPAGIGLDASLNFRFAEMKTLEEVNEQLEALRYGPAIQGLVRSSGSTFIYSDFASASMNMWKPFTPTTTTDYDYTAQTAGGDWYDVPLKTFVTGFTCMGSSWPASGTVTHTLASSQVRRTLPRPIGVHVTRHNDSSWFGERNIYGATVQVSVAQCNTYDRLELPVWLAGSGTTTYDAATCTLFIEPLIRVSVAEMRANVESVVFTNGVPTRPEVTFAILYWDVPNQRLIMDVESQNIFTWLGFNTAKTWLETYDACRSLGRSWTLAIPTTAVRNKLLRMNQSVALPVGIFGYTGDTDYFFGVYRDQTLMLSQYVNWDTPTYPTTPYSAARCVHMEPTTGRWRNTGCNTAQYTTVMCESTERTLAYSVSYVKMVGEFDTSFPMFSNVDLNNRTTIYGATAQMKRSEWLPTDLVLLHSSNDLISVKRHDEGVLHFVGNAPAEDFRYLLSNLWYHGFLKGRTSLSFTYLWWTSNVRDMVYDESTAHVYSTIQAAWLWDPSTTNYNKLPMAGMCAAAGMYPAEVRTYSEHLVQRITRPPNSVMHLGGRRQSPTVFEWISDSSAISNDLWRPFSPSTGAAACLVHNVYGDWVDYDCRSRVLAVACEKNTWPDVVTEVHASLSSVVPLTYATRDMTAKVADYTDATQIGEGFVFGVTVQIPRYHCANGDTFHIDLSYVPNCTATHTACELYVACSTVVTAAVLRTLVRDYVTFTHNSPYRDVLTFAVSMWTKPNRSTFVDPETMHKYATITFDTPMTWLQAFDECRTLGEDWKIMTADRDSEITIVGTRKTPIGLLYVAPAFIHGVTRPTTQAISNVIQWNAGFPITPLASFPCVYTNVEGLWENSDCSTTTFNSVICEKPEARFSFVTSFAKQGNPLYVPVFPNSANLPAVHVPPVYGVTVQRPLQEVFTGERWAFRNVSSAVIVRRASNGIVHLTGETSAATGTEYAAMLRGLWIFAGDARTTGLTIGTIVWTTKDVRHLVLDFVTRRAYASFPTHWYADASASNYPYNNLNALCAAGFLTPMVTAEPISNVQYEQARESLGYGFTALVGATRSSGQTFVWNVGGAMTANHWRPRYPTTNAASTCVVMTAVGMMDVSCTTQMVDSTVCSLNVASSMSAFILPIQRNVSVASFVRTLPAVASVVRMRVLDALTELGWLDETVEPLYGASVHLSGSHCDPSADRLYANVSQVTGAGGVKVRHFIAGCAVFFDARAPIPADVIVNCINTVRFSTTRMDRTQLSFAVTVWQQPQARFHMVDASTRAVTAILKRPHLVSWDQAERDCRELGEDWNLVAINTDEQQKLISTVAGQPILNQSRRDVPLGLSRSNGGTDKFTWSDNSAMTFGNWDSTEPTAAQCSAMNLLTGRWYSRDCTTRVFDAVICQNKNHSAVTTINWVASASAFVHDFSVVAFAASDLPSGPFTSRGVTVQIRASQCVDGDRFVLTTNNDRLTVLRDDHCLLWIGGDASSAEYAAVLTGIRVVGALGLRTAINVGAVYWTNPLVRNMVIDTLTANVYGTYTTNWYWTTPVALNNAYDVNTLCTSNAMNAASISTAEEDREVLRAARYLPAVIGGQRSGVTTTFAWSNGVDTWTYSAWKPLLPSTTSSQTCVEATVSGWVDVDCATSRQSQIVCEAPAASWAQKASVTLAITPFVHTYTTVRTLPATISALTIITPTTDLDWIAVDVVKVFGATVQVATHQCDATADVFSAQNLTLPVTIRRWTSACALFFDAPYGISIAQIKSLLATVRFSTTNTVRSQLSFAVSAWMTPGAKFSMVDADSKTTYAVVYPSSTPVTWMTAFDTCKSLGFDWTLPTLTNPQQSLAARAHLRTDMALGLVREVQGTGRFVWHDGAAMTFGNWRSAEPASDLCAAVSATDGQWYTVDCATTVHFASVMCQSTKASRLLTMINWAASASAFVHDFSVVAFAASDLPSGPFTSRGVTVQIRASQCVDGDRFVLTTNNDRLTVLRDDHCLLWIGGDASSAEYAAVLTGIRVVGALGLRTAINVGAVYWTNPLVRNMVIDTLTANVYGTYTTNWYWTTPVALNNAYDVNTLCTSNAMNAASISTAEEDREVLRAARYLPAVIGGQRSGVTTTFAWSNGVDTWTYSAWKPLLPSTTSSQTCVEATVSGWVDVDCATSRQSQIVCEAPAASWAQKASVTLAITPFVHTYTTVRTLPATISALTIITPTTDLDWIAVDVAKVFGATVQVATHQCDATADVFSAQNLTLPVTIRRRTSACALFFDAPYGISIAQIKSLLATVRFSTTNTVRSQLSFAVSAWMTPGAKFSMVDADSKTTYAVVYPSSTPVTWMTAFDTCKSLGFDWTLPTLTNPQQSLAARAHLRTDMALGLVREAHGTGRFVWHDGAAMTFGNWRSAEPASDLCAAVSATDGQWYTVDCATTVHFASVMCQSTKASRLLTMINWAASASAFVHDFSVVAFAASDLPSGPFTSRGVTVQIRASQCVDGDRFVLTTNNDRLTVLRDDHCLLWIGGDASSAEYAAVLTGIRVVGALGLRTAINVGAVYWTNPLVRNMVIDTLTANVYGTYTTNWYWTTPVALNNAYDVNTLCTSNAMNAASISTAEEDREVLRAARYLPAVIGGQRSGVTTTFAWSNGVDTWTYSAWKPLLPSTTSSQTCVEATVSGWVDVDCATTRQSQIVCEAPAASWTQKASVTLAITPFVHTYTTVRTLPATISALTIITPTTDLDWIAVDVVKVFGATVQVATHQCDATADVFSAQNLTLPVTIRRWTSACALFFDAPYGISIAQIKSLLATVRFSTTNTVRSQLSFAVSAWMTPGAKFSMVDADSKTTYAVVYPSSTPVTWMTAFDTCKSLGFDWTLPTLTNPQQSLAARAHLRTDMALGLVREVQGTGRFVWHDGAAMTFGNWRSAEPASDLCAAISATDGQWYTVDCATTAHFASVMCQSTKASRLLTTINWATDAFSHDQAAFVVQSGVAPASSETIYGASINIVRSPCFKSDHFVLKTNNDKITLLSADDCILHVAGAASAAEYAALLEGVDFQAFALRRSSISFGFSMWRHPLARMLLTDVDTASVFTVQTTNWYYQTPTPAWDAFTHDAPSACIAAAMIPAELNSSLRVALTVSAQGKTATAWIGLLRDAGLTFKWASGLPTSYTSWLSFRPQLTSDNCVYQDSTGYWNRRRLRRPSPAHGL
jgi:hypothetical protein